MTDPDDLLERMADCIARACRIIDDTDDEADDWLAEAYQPLTEHKDGLLRLMAPRPSARTR